MPFEGLTARQLGKRIGAASCLSLTKVTSTLDVVHELAADGSPDGTVVLAEEQVQGRGTRGRSWISPPGSGIWLGYLLRTFDRAPTGVLAIRVGLGLVNALAKLDIDAMVKWPNDIMIGDRKAGGVLCEARTTGHKGWIAVGVGVNVYGPISPEVAEIAVSLDQFSPTVTRIAVLELLIPILRKMSDDPVLTESEVAEFTARDWLVDRRISGPSPGTARGIDRDGALIVEEGGVTKKIFGGTVVLV